MKQTHLYNVWTPIYSKFCHNSDLNLGWVAWCCHHRVSSAARSLLNLFLISSWGNQPPHNNSNARKIQWVISLFSHCVFSPFNCVLVIWCVWFHPAIHRVRTAKQQNHKCQIWKAWDFFFSSFSKKRKQNSAQSVRCWTEFVAIATTQCHRLSMWAESTQCSPSVQPKPTQKGHFPLLFSPLAAHFPTWLLSVSSCFITETCTVYLLTLEVFVTWCKNSKSYPVCFF